MLGELLIDTRDANKYAFPGVDGGFSTGRFTVVDRSSRFETRVRGEDSHVWFTTSEYWPKREAVVARAVLGTTTVSSVQRLRVMYQLSDAHGNTLVSVSGESRVYYAADRFISCAAPAEKSGVGECSGLLDPSLFDSQTSLSLSLHTYNGIVVTDFAAVSVLPDPAWYRKGGWDGSHLLEAVFGVVLPFEDVYIAGGASAASFDVQVRLKSKMSGLTDAQRTVSTGQFELRWSGPHGCSVQSYRSTNSAWSTLAPASAQQPDSYLVSVYGLHDDRWSQAQGEAISVMTVTMHCGGAGVYNFSIETIELGDANPADCTPTVTLGSTALGRDGGYGVSATVRLVETHALHMFAYTSDGRAYVNNFQLFDQPPTSISVHLDSISNNPNHGRSLHISCTGHCSYTPTAEFEGNASLRVHHGALSDVVTVNVRRPRNVSLSADAVRLSALGVVCANTTKFASSQLRLVSDGLDVTQLATFVSSSPAVAEVVGSVVVGRAPGQATISAGISGANITIIVDGNATAQPTLVARVVTRLDGNTREQSFVSEQSRGYLYAYALYPDGHAAPLEASELVVDMALPSRLTYGVEAGSMAVVGVAQNTLRSGCYERLLSVSLATCSKQIGTVDPPLRLHELPEPVGVEFELSDVDVAADPSFARSGALSTRPSEYGKVTVAQVRMSDGSTLSLLRDARVRLTSSNSSCVAVIPNLSSARMVEGGCYRAVGECTSVAITATFTLGTWSRSANATVYLAKAAFMSMSAQLYPSGGDVSTLRELGCTGVRQRAQYHATYSLESGSGFRMDGTVRLAHADVTQTLHNLQHVTGSYVFSGKEAGSSELTLSLRVG